MTHKESVSLVEAAAGEELSAGREGDAVHRLLVPAQHAGQCRASRHQHHSRHAGLCRHHHHVTVDIMLLNVNNSIIIPMIIIMMMVDLVNVWTQVPFSTSHRRTVESKLAEAST